MARISNVLTGVGVVCLLLEFACKRGPTEPQFKDPRDYQWTIDTLAVPGVETIMMQCIWGSSPTDIYIAGLSSGQKASMFHYDGKVWSPVKTSGVGSGVEFFAILGFAPNDIFAVGDTWSTWTDSSFIMHYDGRIWTNHRVSNGRALFTIWGCSSKDVWAGGHAGTLYHYDGNNWSKVAIDPRVDIKSISGLASYDIYLLGTQVNDPVNYYLNYTVLYHYDGAAWQIIDSMSIAASQFGTSFGEVKLGYIGVTLYSIGYGIYAMESDGWHREQDTDYAIQWLYAPTPSTAFAVGQGSLIYYFDGQRWERLKNVIDAGHWLKAVWSTGNETFIIGDNGLEAYKTLVLHGK